MGKRVDVVRVNVYPGSTEEYIGWMYVLFSSVHTIIVKNLIVSSRKGTEKRTDKTYRFR